MEARGVVVELFNVYALVERDGWVVLFQKLGMHALRGEGMELVIDFNCIIKKGDRGREEELNSLSKMLKKVIKEADSKDAWGGEKVFMRVELGGRKTSWIDFVLVSEGVVVHRKNYRMWALVTIECYGWRWECVDVMGKRRLFGS